MPRFNILDDQNAIKEYIRCLDGKIQFEKLYIGVIHI